MSSFDSGEDFLAHYGVKGMHWGIRNDDGLSEEDRRWKKAGVSKEERKAAVSSAKKDFSKAMLEVNANPEHKDIPIELYGAESGSEPPRVRKYYDEVLTVAQRSFDKASLRFPPSPSGKLRFRLVANSPYGWTGSTALDDHVFWDLEVVDSSVLEHSVTGEFIAHYGVKGMHWGIRNEPIKPVVDVFPLKKTRQTARMFISGYRMYKMYKVVRGFMQKLGPVTAFHETNTPVWQNTLISDIS